MSISICSILYEDAAGQKCSADWTDDGWRISRWDGTTWVGSDEPDDQMVRGICRTLRLGEFGQHLLPTDISQVPAYILTRARDMSRGKQRDAARSLIGLIMTMR